MVKIKKMEKIVDNMRKRYIKTYFKKIGMK